MPHSLHKTRPPHLCHHSTSIMMLLGTIIAIIGTKALGDESQLGLQWGAVTGIIAGASSPLVGLAVQVAVERAIGTIAAAWLAYGVLVAGLSSAAMATLACIVGFFGCLLFACIYTWHASKLFLLSLFVVIFGSYGVDPTLPTASPVYVAAARTAGFTAGAIVLAVLWVVLLPTSSTGQVVAAFHTALQKLTALQADVFGIIGVHMTEDTPTLPKHVAVSLETNESTTKSRTMFAAAGEMAAHVQHDAFELYGGLLAKLHGLQSMRHERYAGTIPWVGTRLILPWRPVHLIFLPPPRPLIPKHKVDNLASNIGTMVKVMEIHSSFVCSIASVPGYESAWMRHPRHVQLEEWVRTSCMFMEALCGHFPKADLVVKDYVPPDAALELQHAAAQVVHPNNETAALCVRLRPFFVRGMAPTALYDVLRSTQEEGPEASWERATVYITVIKLLVEYVTEHLLDLYEAVNDFLESVPGSGCVVGQRPVGIKARWLEEVQHMAALR